ncbi:flagellin, partial [Campylobacter jejuni]|nr:flagellin [Campylobacter jejuni]
MGFRINTNIGALNAHANSVVNARELDKSLSRLSSGLRINSAADDASGMAIADSLRSQAATLGQAINNGNDAIGILQTADKAMDEQLKILDTIKTKATQAAQDGQSLKTRTMLQADINRLMEELDNIANTTSFNGKQLLSGNFINQEFQIGASSNQTVKASIGATQSSKIGLTRFETGERISSSGDVQFTLKNYNGIDDFKFQKVVISTSVGTGLGALADEINKNADKTGVRATFTVETRGMGAVRAGA